MNLYHYCSSEVFHSVISKREIWLSALSLSNDTMEGKWLRKVFRIVCEEKGLNRSSTEQVMELFGGLDTIAEGLGYCLSEHSDMMSQWRGYANDGAGFCIGFNSDYLVQISNDLKSQERPSFKLTQVQYDLEEQKKIVLPTFEKVKEYVDAGALRHGLTLLEMAASRKEEVEKKRKEQESAFRNMGLAILTLLLDMYGVKNPAFSEEREWRLVSYFVSSVDDGTKFRPSPDRIIPYRIYDLPPKEIVSIAEVVLGPKNITPPALVETFLKLHGFEDVKVYKSAATYR